ncbi:hypothetical protein CC78DRAFT_146635 [Lojkania enalia]|uniref:Uncharacterized protein n=1 Tax=Lojkania enalia TaxID=147567 RepID=A0A9P4KD56_9PLEO|nr:hypothetical protein CC78DRAFT_146635 [Didymosphaeria enalia]
MLRGEKIALSRKAFVVVQPVTDRLDWLKKPWQTTHNPNQKSPTSSFLEAADNPNPTPFQRFTSHSRHTNFQHPNKYVKLSNSSCNPVTREPLANSTPTRLRLPPAPDLIQPQPQPRQHNLPISSPKHPPRITAATAAK